MKRILISIIFLGVFTFTITTVISRGFREAQIPNGITNKCANCHIDPNGGSSRNTFGKLIGTKFLTEPGSAGNVVWDPLLASLDADNDGVTNGEELMDPCGQWTKDQSNPGDANLVSLPGNPNSISITPVTISFSEMNPHIGQTVEMRVVQQNNGEEVGRTKINTTGPDFVLSVPNIEMDYDYNVDFYANHNNNGQYDAPSTNHAWQISFNSSTGNFVQNFSHSPNFIDINWTNITGVRDEISALPNNYKLQQNFPNPFNPTTNITFNLKEDGLVNLTIYDILGQEVTTLVNKNLPSGSHSVDFNATNLQSGNLYL